MNFKQARTALEYCRTISDSYELALLHDLNQQRLEQLAATSSNADWDGVINVAKHQLQQILFTDESSELLSTQSRCAKTIYGRIRIRITH